jgi:hypothetical protein
VGHRARAASERVNRVETGARAAERGGLPGVGPAPARGHPPDAEDRVGPIRDRAPDGHLGRTAHPAPGLRTGRPDPRRRRPPCPRTLSRETSPCARLASSSNCGKHGSKIRQTRPASRSSRPSARLAPTTHNPLRPSRRIRPRRVPGRPRLLSPARNRHRIRSRHFWRRPSSVNAPV